MATAAHVNPADKLWASTADLPARSVTMHELGTALMLGCALDTKRGCARSSLFLQLACMC